MTTAELVQDLIKNSESGDSCRSTSELMVAAAAKIVSLEDDNEKLVVFARTLVDIAERMTWYMPPQLLESTNRLLAAAWAVLGGPPET